MPNASKGLAVEIRGQGLAACACSSLLQRKGFPLFIRPDVRAKLPAILANRATQSLLGDIFADHGLFEGLRQINQRIVAWGNVEAMSVPHSAVVISEQTLLESLWERIPAPSSLGSGIGDWIIAGSRACRISNGERAFGTREATATEVELAHSSPRDACWIEALRSGWLFLFPVGLSAAGERHAMLIAVGSDAESLLDESKLVKQEVAEVREGGQRLFCSPRISTTLAGQVQAGVGWLGCGTAAMSFDPISGEGAGHAAREAILAAAVISAVSRGLSAERLLAHYAARLTAGFQRHLEICRRFYTQARAGPWWDREIELLREGIAWCQANIDVAALREFQLVDFDLQPRT